MGLRPIEIWVPDTRAPGFAEEARRQSLAVSRGPEAEALTAWVERNSDPWDDLGEPPALVSDRYASPEFSEVWQRVTALQAGQPVPVWSYDAGFSGARFELARIDQSCVVIAPPGVARLHRERRVHRADFQNVYRLWHDYQTGRLPRGEVGKISQNTTYIFAILRLVGAG
jgi:hypothetical protein